MNSVRLFLLGALCLHGCSTEPVAPGKANLLEAPPSFRTGSARVIVVRDPGYLASACAVTVSVDGRVAGDLRPGDKVDLRIEPAEGVIVARQHRPCSGGTVSAEYRVKPGQSVSYRIGFQGEGVMGLFRY